MVVLALIPVVAGLLLTALVGHAAPALLAAPIPGVAGAASATRTAVRMAPPAAPADAPSMCARIAGAIARRHPGATQQLVVRTATWTDTTAVVQLATFSGAGWTCGPEMPGRIGRNGLRPLLERRSGDGTTPAGVFGLATMTAWDGQRFSFFGNAADPGVSAGTYRAVRTGDCFGATPNTPGYGHLRNDVTCGGADDEYLPELVGAYTNAALIDANMEPAVSGDAPGEIPYAAAIFLHRHVYQTAGTESGATKPTSGCVSLAQVDLSRTLVALRSDVVFVMGPTDWLLTSA